MDHPATAKTNLTSGFSALWLKEVKITPQNPKTKSMWPFRNALEVKNMHIKKINIVCALKWPFFIFPIKFLLGCASAVKNGSKIRE